MKISVGTEQTKLQTDRDSLDQIIMSFIQIIIVKFSNLYGISSLKKYKMSDLPAIDISIFVLSHSAPVTDDVSLMVSHVQHAQNEQERYKRKPRYLKWSATNIWTFIFCIGAIAFWVAVLFTGKMRFAENTQAREKINMQRFKNVHTYGILHTCGRVQKSFLLQFVDGVSNYQYMLFLCTF